MLKERILRWAISIAGVISLALFIVTKSERLMDMATASMFEDGDLYRFAKVLEFKTTMPARVCREGDEPDSDPDTASMIIIGDSFMETCRGHVPFPADIASRTGRSVYPEYAGLEPECFDPVYFCWKNNLDPDKKRTIVLERIERYILHDYINPPDTDYADIKGSENERVSWLTTVKHRWFTQAEKNYEVFLTSSDIMSPVIELWNTFRFATLRQISDQTPRYSINPPFLFEKEEVSPVMNTSFYFRHTDSVIAKIADNLAFFKQMLKERYNADFWFMPVPNAYTLYHRFVTKDRYDNYIPRLCEALEKRGVRVINLYPAFRASDEILFFPTDTHWNAEGEQLAAQVAMKSLAQTGNRQFVQVVHAAAR